MIYNILIFEDGIIEVFLTSRNLLFRIFFFSFYFNQGTRNYFFLFFIENDNQVFDQFELKFPSFFRKTVRIIKD